MQQYKIPEEINVEDKVIGPFTLKSFGFIFAGIVVCLIVTQTLRNAGMPFTMALIFGIFCSSGPLALGFAHYNGRPVYTYTPSFLSYLIRPKKRIWKKELNTSGDIVSQQSSPKVIEELKERPKESLEAAGKQIEEISLMVDTGGTYEKGSSAADDETELLDSQEAATIDHALSQAQAEAIKSGNTPEPPISEMASVDPEKKFKYAKPDTSSYTLDKYGSTENNSEGKEEGR